MQDDLLEQQPAEEELAGGDEHLDSGEEAARKLVQEVQINVLGACQRHVRVSIPREEIDRYVEETVGKLALDAVVPGFRPGRAPRKLVERRFRKEVLQQVKSSLLNDSVAQLIDDYDLVPISEPELEEEHVLLPETGPMVYEFHLEVRPEFELPQWKGLELESLDEQVTDQDVEEAVRALLLRYGTLEPTSEPAAKGDHVTVNLTFRHGERLLRELREQELALAPRLLFRDAILEGFDALLAGARPGERRTGTLTLSSDVADPALRGQQVEVELEVLDVKRPQPAPINEALLQRVGGFQDEQELRQAVRRSLTLRYEFEARRHLRNQIRQKLLAQANWDLPPGLLRRQAQREIERFMLELRASGYDEDTILARVNEVRLDILANTRWALQEHFLLERIAEEEGIKLTEEDIDLEVALIAAQQQESPRRVRARLEKSNQMDALYNLAIERHVLQRILDHATFTKVERKKAEVSATALDESVCGEAAPESAPPSAELPPAQAAASPSDSPTAGPPETSPPPPASEPQR
jgi:trigger factor